MREKIRNLLIKIGYSSKPSFLIIGAQKAGTSGLYKILNQHSLLMGSRPKEIHYFDNDDWYAEKKLNQYHSFFPLSHQVPNKGLVFEATPIYLFHPKVAQRLYFYNPYIKLIVLLREPASRALSAWTMYHHHFKTGENKYLHDRRSFTEAISEEMKDINKMDYYSNKIAYVKRGIYHYQIEAYFKYFSKDQILFIESNELKAQFENSIKTILSFINMPYEKLDLSLSNTSKVDSKEKYEKEILKLKEFYEPYNQKLFKLIGKEFKWND